MTLHFAGALAQAGKFGVVGVLNTVIDFSIFNALTAGRRVPDVVANICSTTVAMIFSFVANRDAVFHGGSGNPLQQAVVFFAVTAVGVWVLQTGVLYLLADRWRWPRRWLQQALRLVGQRDAAPTDLIMRNAGKIGGTVVSLVWNFVMYKYVVFR